jgi:hypothetical protein
MNQQIFQDKIDYDDAIVRSNHIIKNNKGKGIAIIIVADREKHDKFRWATCLEHVRVLCAKEAMDMLVNIPVQENNNVKILVIYCIQQSEDGVELISVLIQKNIKFVPVGGG